MMGLGLPLLLVAATFGVERAPPEPEPVVLGTDAALCEFPAAASALRFSGDHMCTVAVVHPRVVMLAAHCIGGGEPASVIFGESSFAPEVSIPIEACEPHPLYNEVNDFNNWDLGYCTLTEDAPAVTIVPPLMGCEADQLVPGAMVTLAGYGMDDEASFGGAGIKRWTVNTVESVDVEANDLYLLGDEGSSVCFGDSGGPAYMQLDDGTWRIVGITSEPHPDTEGMELVCGYGAIYDLVHLEMEWFEQQTGYDLTPCFDVDGTWVADEECGFFPTSITTAGLDWSTACATDELSEYSATCGDPFDDGTVGTSTGAATSGSTGDAESSTGMDGSTTDPPSDDTTSTTAPPPPPTSGTDASTSPPASGDEEGCGCRSASPPSWWLLALLPAFRRRRRNS